VCTLVMCSLPPEPRLQMIRCLENRKHCLSPSFFREREPSRPRVTLPRSLIGTWIREPGTHRSPHTHTYMHKHTHRHACTHIYSHVNVNVNTIFMNNITKYSLGWLCLVVVGVSGGGGGGCVSQWWMSVSRSGGRMCLAVAVGVSHSGGACV